MNELETEHYYLKNERDTEFKMSYDEWFAFCTAADNVLLLKLAVEKWQFIADALTKFNTVIYDGGVHSCPLCRKYYGVECPGCPIRIDTDQPWCDGTHYESYSEWEMDFNPAEDTIAEGLNYATKELEYLKSLLEKYTKEQES